MWRNITKFFTLLLLFFLIIGLSQEANGQKTLPFPVSLFKLKNGLTVILSEDFSIPVVSMAVIYNVGSINERPGKTGLSYLLENLMFYGSRNVGRMQHIRFIQRIGGILNAVTTEDKTIFYQTVPSNQLPLVLWLESDRMNFLSITPSNVQRAKETVIEEIYHRIMTELYLESSMLLDQLVFPEFAYGHPVFGYEIDLREITVEDVKNFYQTYYISNNAVLSICGNINKQKTQELVQKYFETIPIGEDPPRLAPASLSKQERIEKTIEGSLASSPGLHIGYRIAPPYSNDFYVLSVIEYILLRGNSSRLQKRLIHKERIANHLSGGIDKRKDLAAFKIFVTSNNDITLERSKKAIFSELNKLKTNIISNEELMKSKNLLKRDFINQYATSSGRAIFLAETYLSKGTLKDLPNELDKYLNVSPSDIIGIMNRYFTQDYILINIKIK